MPFFDRFTAATLFLTCTLSCPSLHAEQALTVDWGRIFKQSEAWVREQSHSKDHASSIELLRQDPDAESPLFGTNPRISLVVRNWEGGRRLAGGYMSVNDAIRVNRSSRMLLTRVAMTSGRIMPFVQIGAGQWRADRDMQPYLSPDSKLASLLGVGLDFALSRGVAFAVESDWTVLYNASRDATSIDATHIFSAFGAVRWEL